MSGLITALAWLLIVLTFTGSYRLAHYLAVPVDESASTVTAFYPTLIAATITLAFVVMFDFVILLMGVAIVALPGYLLVNPEGRPGVPRVRGRLPSVRERLVEWGHRWNSRVPSRRASSAAPPDADPEAEPDEEA